MKQNDKEYQVTLSASYQQFQFFIFLSLLQDPWRLPFRSTTKNRIFGMDMI